MAIDNFDTKAILAGDLDQFFALINAVNPTETDGKAESLLNLAQCRDLLEEAEIIADKDSLSDAINNLLETRNQDLKAEVKVYLYAANRLFSLILNTISIESVLISDINHLRLPFIKVAIDDPHIFCDIDHPAIRILEDILQSAATWYPNLGKYSDTYQGKLGEITNILHTSNLGTEENITEYAKLFRTYLESERKRSQSIAERAYQSECGAVKIFRAQKLVTDTLNRSLAGTLLPAEAADFIQDSLRREFQYVLINQGHTAEIWLDWIRVLKKLAWVFKENKTADEKKRFQDEVSYITETLTKNFNLNVCHQEDYEEFTQRLTSQLINVLQGISVACIKVEKINLANEMEGIKTILGQAITDKAKQLNEGDWFIFQKSDTENIRCKLERKIPDTDYLLFVNACGNKVMSKTVEDFLMCIYTKIAKPINIEISVEQTTEKLLHELIDQYQNNQQKLRYAAAKKAKLKAEATLKKQQEFKRKQAAAQKAMEEAQAIAEIEAKKLKQEQELALSKKQAEIVKIIEDLNVGAWLELLSEDDEPTPCKIGVYIQSMEKYILVDRLGIKVGEYYREDLLNLLVDGRAKVLSTGEKFEDQLAKIVRGLRRDVN